VDSDPNLKSVDSSQQIDSAAQRDDLPPLSERISEALNIKRHVGRFPEWGVFSIILLAALYIARAVIIPFVFALMLYFLLRPVMRGLKVLHIPRAIAGILVLGTVIGAIGFAAVRLSGPAAEWAERLPQSVRMLERKSEALRKPVAKASEIAGKVERVADVGRDEQIREVAVVKPTLFDSLIEGAAAFTTEFLVMLVTAYFLLMDGDALLGRLVRLLPDMRDRARAGLLMTEVERRMSQYMLTVTLINTVLGAALGSVLQLLGMPNPLLWGIMAGVLTYVPYVGPAIGIGVVALASFVTFPTASAAIGPPIAYLILSTIEGNFVTPVILGRAFKISPLVVFVWVIFWAWLWSVPGAIVAVPLLMLIKIVCEQSPALAPVAALMKS
jgi:predicted PurR-regulated permease PerM